MGLEWRDLNPLTWPGQVKSRLKKDFSKPEDTQKTANLNNQGGMASIFADQGQLGYHAMGAEAQAAREALRRRAMGQDSLSAEQLRQGLGQQLAAQRSMAVSASPQNAPMAARTAAIQMGRNSAGMSGNAAMAGIAERQAAEKQLGDMIMQQRQQDAQVALGSRQNANTAFGAGTEKQGKSNAEKAAPYVAAFAKLFSDERLKTDIKDGDDKAARVLKGLKSYSYKYKNEDHGKGEQYGIMAQELEKSGLGHAVVDTPQGKMVDGAKAAASGLALVAALGRRVEKLEGKKGRK